MVLILHRLGIQSLTQIRQTILFLQYKKQKNNAKNENKIQCQKTI